jgi:cobyrinic acid a,c-diamide synthase
MIAGTGSGCGKTTITCAILKALANRGLKVASFKCGPDYIDPMFHTKVTGINSSNLDMFLCGEDAVKQLFSENSQGNDISVVEGVMGFYDGIGFKNTEFSSNDFSNKTNTPVILVVNAKGMALSIVALIKGYLNFSKNTIKGIILNGISEGMYPMYKEIIEKNNDVKVLGFMPNIPEATIGSRHLGLVTANEIDDLRKKIDFLAANASKYIDLDGIIKLSNEVPELYYKEIQVEKIGHARIALARDRAFCFYYEDNLRLLRKLGAEIIEFSPLNDKSLPEDIDGIILGGGYPELYVDELSKNTTMLESIRNAIERAIPTYAECGGFIYLGTAIEDRRMVNVINTKTILTNRLQNFGYIKLIAEEDNLFCKKGESINAHEFHYAKSEDDGDAFTAIKKSSGRLRKSIFANESLYAGYPHLHLWGNINFAKAFIKKCIEYRGIKEMTSYKED